MRLPALLAFAFVLGSTAVAQSPAPRPALPLLEDLFAEPEIRSVQLAPDGQHLAFLSPIQGRVALILFDLGTGKAETLARANDENIKSFFWKDNDTVVYSGDVGGNESSSIIAISVKSRNLTRLAESYRPSVDSDAPFAEIIDSMKFVPGSVLIRGRSSRGGLYVDLAWLDVHSGERKSVSGGEEETSNWLADDHGWVRARNRNAGDKQLLEVADTDHGLFKAIAEWPVSLGVFAQGATALGFKADGETLYVAKNDPIQGCSLFSYNTHTQKWSEPLFTTPTGEIQGIALSWDHTRLLAVTYVEDRTVTHFFDADRERLQRQIDASLPPGMENRVRSVSQDGKLLVISASNDLDPGVYYILDLRAKPHLALLGRIYPKIQPAAMLPMRSIEYPARDGLLIHGYLTLPRQAAAGKVPLIIHPHGGPFGIRDNWGFNPEVQFLASRGYAVLQPNYRGSGGYGARFLQAGAREWGGKMQDDLTDGVKWAIAQGIADPKRVAILGASYGGYAALAGVTFTPELYCCAVNYVGVSNLAIQTNPGRSSGRMFSLFTSEWVGDSDLIRQRSPINFINRIQVPTLHAYGENDPRVDIKNWQELEHELKRLGKPYEFVREENEGHGFRNEPARINFYRKVETFLADHLAQAGHVEIKATETIEFPAQARK